MIDDWNYRSVRMLLVDGRATSLLLGCLDEIGVVHPERTKQVRAQVVAQRLAADLFDQLPNPVDADAIFPPIARVGEERLVERAPLAVYEIGKFVFLEIAQDDSVRPVVPITGRMREQLARRDRPFGRPQLRRAVGLEAIEHLHCGELRQDVACWFIELE